MIKFEKTDNIIFISGEGFTDPEDAKLAVLCEIENRLSEIGGIMGKNQTMDNFRPPTTNNAAYEMVAPLDPDWAAMFTQDEKQLAYSRLLKEIDELRKKEDKAKRLLSIRRKQRTSGFRTIFSEDEMKDMENE